MSNLIVLYKDPAGEIERLTVENTLDAFHDLVHGYIECVPWHRGPHGERRVLIVNEEGKLHGMARNFVLPGTFDWICGPAVWVGYDGGDEFISVDPELFSELQDLTVWSEDAESDLELEKIEYYDGWDPQDALAALLSMYDRPQADEEDDPDE